jgi:hypothetical protein
MQSLAPPRSAGSQGGPFAQPGARVHRRSDWATRRLERSQNRDRVPDERRPSRCGDPARGSLDAPPDSRSPPQASPAPPAYSRCARIGRRSSRHRRHDRIRASITDAGSCTLILLLPFPRGDGGPTANCARPTSASWPVTVIEIVVDRYIVAAISLIATARGRRVAVIRRSIRSRAIANPIANQWRRRIARTQILIAIEAVIVIAAVVYGQRAGPLPPVWIVRWRDVRLHETPRC